jgi:hypothetical protein
MSYRAYNLIMWDIYTTDEYLAWFSALSEYDKEEINFKVHLLEEFGPNLSRPHADTLKGSWIKNLKERNYTKTTIGRRGNYGKKTGKGDTGNGINDVTRIRSAFEEEG